MKRKIRLLQYGVRHEHAPGKLETFKLMSDDFEIVAVVDDSARANPTYHTFPINLDGVKVIPEKGALDLEGIDAVAVETANVDLQEIALECAKRGLAMHLEKPCGETLTEFKNIVEICRRGNVPLQMGYMFRGNPAIRALWGFVKKGYLGEIISVEADMNHDYGDDSYQCYVGTFKGGIMYNLGCHLVDAIVPILGGLPKSAKAVIGNAAGDSKECLNRTEALLEYENATVLLKACSRIPNGVMRRRLRVDGTKGAFELSPIERFDGKDLTAVLTLKEDAGEYRKGETLLNFGVQRDRYEIQLKELASIIRGDIPNVDYYDHDLLVHKISLMASGYDV